MQDQALKDSVHQFHKAVRRLNMPPHPDFVGWRRTRQQTRAAAAAAASDADATADSLEGESSTAWGMSLTLLAICAATLPFTRTGRASLRRWRSARDASRDASQLRRKVSRAAVEQRPPRVPTSSSVSTGLLPRSCSLSQIDLSLRVDGRGDASALLFADEGKKLAGSRRSLSASDLANVLAVTS